MKFTFAFLLFVNGVLFCKAQNELLPVDEQGKFIYYELVEAKGISTQQLKETLSSLLNKPFYNLTVKRSQGDTIFMASGKFVINKTVLVMSHPSGEIVYHFQAEVKADKFRFWLTNFNFIPYQRDRYGNFVASTSKGIPLESSIGKLNATQWREYQTQAANNAKQFAEAFKDHMLNKQNSKMPNEVKKLIRKDW